jgi:hypothetical protein
MSQTERIKKMRNMEDLKRIMLIEILRRSTIYGR